MSSLENLPLPEEKPQKKMHRTRRAAKQSLPARNPDQGLKSDSAGISSVSVAIQLQANNNESAVDTYNEIVDRILLNAESRRGPRHSTIFESSSLHSSDRDDLDTKLDAMHGTLSAEELNQLSLLSTAVVSTHEGMIHGYSDSELMPKGNSYDFNWSCVDIDSVSQLSGLLEEHVRSALSIDLIREARESYDQEDKEWFQQTSQKSHPPGMRRFLILNQGLQAANILLAIMISPGIDRRVVNEDVIESIISLMKSHLTKHIIPALSCTGHTALYSPADPDDVPEESPRKKQKVSSKRRKSSAEKDDKASQQHLMKFLKAVYSSVSSTVGLFSNLIERLDVLVHAFCVEDQPLLSICSSALSSLTIDPATGVGSQENASFAHAVQMSCVSLITTIFRKYPKHRIVILEDLFPLFLKIPTSKRSMRTFPVRLCIKTSPAPAVNGKKSSIASCRVVTPHGGLRSDGQDFIQFITALILYMIQACVTMPHAKSYQDDDAQSSKEDEGDVSSSKCGKKKKGLTSGLKECERVSRIFTSLLIQRCSKKGEEGGASEFRPILSNLVEDLLLVQLLPQFPSADMLLLDICRRLCDDLVANSAICNGKKVVSSEATYLTTAMDTIGTICSNIASKISLARENPLVFPNEVDVDALDECADPSSNSKEVNRCSCGRTTLIDTFMLDCDRCHHWFHGSCVGIAKDKLPDVWICDECTMQIMVLEQMKVFSTKLNDKEPLRNDQGKIDLSNEDKIHIMRILLLNFLSHQERMSRSSFSSLSRQFHLARFVKDIDTDSSSREGNVFTNLDLVYSHFIDVWNLKLDGDESAGYFSQNEQRCEYLSEEGNAKLMLTLNASKSQLVASLPQLLGVIVALMGDENIVSLRKLAVKALSQIVQMDSSLMSQSVIKEAATRRFNDEAISVREAAVSLVGFYVLQTPDAAKAFHVPLLLRLNDDGISVRKRVIKIFRDLIDCNPSYPERATVLMLLLARASDKKEDDGVRDLIVDTFLVLWFNCDDSNQSAYSSAALVTPLRDAKSKRTNFARETAKQMVEVVAVSSSPCHLKSLVQGMINDHGGDTEEEKGNQKKIDRVAAKKHCTKIVASLIEELVLVEENRDSMSQDKIGSRLVSLLTTLRVFAEACPSLLVNHYENLLHYLKADNGVPTSYESSILIQVCKILSHVSPSLNGVNVQRLSYGDISKDLVKIIYRFGMFAAGAAVECLVKLANHHEINQNNPLMTALMKVIRTFYTHLMKMKNTSLDPSKFKNKERNNIHRALSVLGFICHHHNITNSDIFNGDSQDFFEAAPASLKWENLPSSCYALFLVYLEKGDTSIKCKAIRALSGVFSSYPRIMLAFEQDGALSKIMSVDTEPELQLESLQCWREILDGEEQRVESGEARRQMESKTDITTSKKVSGDQDGDASLIGACCIQHATRIFEMTSSDDPKIRLHSLYLIGTLLRQGLLNPMEVVPVLFGLQGDLQHPQIRLTSLKMLEEETDKRPDMIRQLLCDGIRHCYDFQMKMYKNPDAITALVRSQGPNQEVQIECIFGQIFRDSIRNSRSHSMRVIQSLLSQFMFRELDESALSRIPLVSFTSEVLAYLPYNHLGDVLYVVHKIANMVNLEGNEVLTRMNSFLRPFGLDSDAIQEDKLGPTPLKSKRSYDNHFRDTARSAFQKMDKMHFAELCAQSHGIVLLVRLSTFLRESFNGVTTTRLMEYQPGEKERITDRGITRINHDLTFNSKFQQAVSSDGKNIKFDVLMNQYIEFLRSCRSFDLHPNSQTVEIESSK